MAYIYNKHTIVLITIYYFWIVKQLQLLEKISCNKYINALSACTFIYTSKRYKINKIFIISVNLQKEYLSWFVDLPKWSDKISDFTQHLKLPILLYIVFLFPFTLRFHFLKKDCIFSPIINIIGVSCNWIRSILNIVNSFQCWEIF